jgi:enamidase
MFAKPIKDILITNLEQIVTGDIKNPLRKADSILVQNKKITKIGNGLKGTSGCREVDAQGMFAIPGLWETHAHNGIDDYAPITKTIDWLENLGRCGVTTVVTEGEHGPGYPRYFDDPVGVKAEAIFINKVFRNWRPGNCVRVYGGGIILVHGLTEKDFKEMADAGVRIVAEIGGGGLARADECKNMCKWAKKYGMFVSIHCGPPSIPGSFEQTAANFIELGADKASHLNGGSTSLPWSHIKDIIDNTDCYLEVVFHSNLKMGVRIVNYVRERDELHRIVFGSDQAIGLANSPGSIWGMIAQIASLTDIPAEQVICMGSGNSANCYKKALGTNHGFIKEGMDADIVITDTPPGPVEAVGNNVLDGMKIGLFCAPACTIFDGQIMGIIGRDYQPTKRHVKIDGEVHDVDDVVKYLFGIPHPGF